MVGEISELGGALVAITPQTVERSTKQMEENPLEYDVLSDAGSEYARLLGIRYELPDYLAELYQQFGLDLPTFHGDGGWTLPIPARIVVDQGGVVRFSEANADYSRRPEPEDTVEVLRRIAG